MIELNDEKINKCYGLLQTYTTQLSVINKLSYTFAKCYLILHMVEFKPILLAIKTY